MLKLALSSQRGSKRPPLDFAGRMAVCDANYLRLRKLMPNCRDGKTRTILLPAVVEPDLGFHALQIRVLETFRYTSTLELSLVIEEAVPAWFKAPTLTVRVYHDAFTAEVVSYQDQRGFKAVYLEDDVPRFNRDEKNLIDGFLADWLTLCLGGGLSQLVLPACLQGGSREEPSAVQDLAG